jgi:hypothetical protein
VHLTILNVKEHYPVPIEISEYRLKKNGKIKLFMSVLFFTGVITFNMSQIINRIFDKNRELVIHIWYKYLT